MSRSKASSSTASTARMRPGARPFANCGAANAASMPKSVTNASNGRSCRASAVVSARRQQCAYSAASAMATAAASAALPERAM